MRILFVNTVDTSGGAAVVLQRLMTGLSDQYGTENRLLVKTKDGDAANTDQLLTHSLSIAMEKIIDRVSRPAGLLYQYFPFSSQRLLKTAAEFRPDIINLHNLQGAYFAVPMLRKLSRLAPLVWTLHDMWSFTGNSSHTFGNMSWKQLRNDRHLTRIPPSIGINTGAWLLRQKRNIYRDVNLTIVTPSIWLRELAVQSPVFENKAIHQIYNGVDTRIYRPLDRAAAKKRLGIPEGRKTILFSSHFLARDNPWKGGQDLIGILSKINARTDSTICFLALGGGKIDELAGLANLDIRYMGYVTDQQKMVECLNAADLFIYPTRADNLPNVLVESIACGTPAVTFDIGGNGEIISHNYNGSIIPPFDLDAFAADTLLLLEDEGRRAELSRNGLIRVREQFEQKVMVSRYYRLFQQIMEKNGTLGGSI